VPQNSNSVAQRRIPQQRRSRERYDRILAAARQLISQRGNDGVSMREIADAATISIGSLYQYFPDKNALLWSLLSDQFDRLETQWLAALEQANNMTEVNRSTTELFDAFVELCVTDEAFSRLWSSAQANTVLAELDNALNRRVADAYTAKYQRYTDNPKPAQVWQASFVMASLSSTALQLAFTAGNDRDQILNEFRYLMALRFREF